MGAAHLLLTLLLQPPFPENPAWWLTLLPCVLLLGQLARWLLLVPRIRRRRVTLTLALALAMTLALALTLTLTLTLTPTPTLTLTLTRRAAARLSSRSPGHGRPPPFMTPRGRRKGRGELRAMMA